MLIRERMRKQLRVDDKGRVEPVGPSKQVITNEGRRFTGLLLEDGEDWTVLKLGHTTLRIWRRNVDRMIDVDLSAAYGTIDPSFAELRMLVIGKEDLGKAVHERIDILT